MRSIVLSEIIDSIESGCRPKGGVDHIGDVPSLGAEHIDSYGGFDFSNPKMVSKDFYEKMSKGKIYESNILIVKDGATTGKVAFVRKDFPYKQASINEHVFLIKTKPIADPQYVFYLLYSNEGKQAILRDFRGATVGGISKSFSDKIKIPLPPLPIQKKIAAILDKADSLRQKDKQLLKHYNKLAQSIFYEMFGDPVRNEKGWDKVRLGTLGEWKSGGTPSREKENRYFNGTIPWVSSGELNQVYIADTKEKITDEAIKESNAKLIEPGAILLGMYDTAGLKSSINTVPLACNQAIAYSHLNNEKTDTLFVYFQIQIAKDFLKSQQRGVRQKNFNLSMIKDIEIISPPLKAQEKFGKAFGKLLSNVQLISRQEQFSTQLFQALIQNAFKGELVKEP